MGALQIKFTIILAILILTSFETMITTGLVIISTPDNNIDLFHDLIIKLNPNSSPEPVESITYNSIWSSTEFDKTSSIICGDYDNDGDLDIAIGNIGESNRLYRNDHGTIARNAVWNSTETDNTQSIVWGDYNKDGYLDLAVGNQGNPNRIYKNIDGSLTSTAIWNSTEIDDTMDIAWGDFDNDGDLDLACGNNDSQPNRIYRNNGGSLTSTSIWNSTETNDTNDIAWSDFDNDGDLDLACGNSNNQSNQIYENLGNSLTLFSIWNSTEMNDTRSIAWGDLDNDGDLDLACGNHYGASKIYMNEGGTLNNTSSWNSTNTEYTNSIDWGDYDNDLDLDLVFGINGQNKLFENNAGTISQTPVWTSIETNDTTSIMWGDYDHDGDLDIFCGNKNISGQRNTLYRNDKSSLILVQSLTDIRANDVLWGDYNGDDYLDIAFGYLYSDPVDISNRVYKNQNGIILPTAIWNSTEEDHTWGITWDDFDGDGDIDLACANADSTEPNRLYLNDNGSLIETAIWNSTETESSKSAAWGDYDNDGDLDLAIGGSNCPKRLYRNDNGTLTQSTVWYPTHASDHTESMVWGDYDNDGDLDLFCGNAKTTGQENRLYQNNEGILTILPIWDTPETDWTREICLGDYDGDGDLDLACGNIYEHNRIYQNVGGTYNLVWNSTEIWDANAAKWIDFDSDGDLDLSFTEISGPYFRIHRNDGGTISQSGTWISTEVGYGKCMDWGDYDKDGDLDLVVGGGLSDNKIFQKRGLERLGLPSTPSRIYIKTPSDGGDKVNINYTIYDDQFDDCWITPYYSLVGGGSWYPATKGQGSDGTTNLTSSPSGTNHTFVWDTISDNVATEYREQSVVFRMVVHSYNNRLSDSFQWPDASSVSQKFLIDNAPPKITINTRNGTWIDTTTPIIDVDFLDGAGLDDGFYKVGGGSWQSIFSDQTGPRFITDFQVSGLVQGPNYIYFNATDDLGNKFESSKPSEILVLIVDTIYPVLQVNTQDGIISSQTNVLVDVDFDDGLGLLNTACYKIGVTGTWNSIFTDLNQSNFSDNFVVSGLVHGVNDVYFMVNDTLNHTFEPTDPQHVLQIIFDIGPEADAGSDKFVQCGDLVVLNGRGSSDPDDCPNGDTAGTILDYDWNVTDDPSNSVTLSDETVSQPSFTAPGKTGSYNFSLRVGDPFGLWSDEDIVKISVTPGDLTSITVTPDSMTVPAGTELEFSASGFDNWNNPVDITPTWEVNGGGTIDPDGTFHATKVGTWSVFANESGISGSVSVTVILGPPDHVIIDPSNTIASAGDKVQFSAIVYDEFENIINDAPITWEITGGGTIDTDGNFHALKTGNWEIFANYTGISGSTTISIRPSIPNTIIISPSSTSLTVGMEQLFSVEVFDTFGNINSTAELIWDASGGGTIDLTGKYHAMTAGAWTIYANSSGVSGSASIIVVPGVPNTIEVDPSSVSINAGQIQVFCAIVIDSHGNQNTTALIKWETNGGGSIDQNGKYQATTAGMWTIFANSTGITSSASVIVNPGIPNTIEIKPSTATINTGETQVFSAIVFDSLGNLNTTALVTWEVNGGGIIDPDGTFHATSVGEWMVTAKSSGLTGTAIITVLGSGDGDNYPPNVVIISPKPGSSQKPPITIEWNATDSDGDVVNIEIQVSTDGIDWKTIHETTGSGSFSWDPDGLEGPFYFRLIATDNKNNETITALEEPINVMSSGSEDEGSWILIAVILVCIIIAVVLLLYFVKSKKKPPKGSSTTDEKSPKIIPEVPKSIKIPDSHELTPKIESVKVSESGSKPENNRNI